MEEILTAIISGVVGPIIEYTLVPVGRQVGYLIYYKSNLENLRSQLKKFDAARDRMKQTVDEVERKGGGVHTDVQSWRTEADKITREAEKFFEDASQAKIKCIHGICLNPVSHHQLSRKSTKLVKMIEEHQVKMKELSFIPVHVRVEETCVTPSQDYVAFESRTRMVKEILTELKNPDINMIGVYGFGGVGKTTLAKDVFRQAKADQLFDDVVIILNVKEKQHDVNKLQKEIAEKFDVEIDESQSTATRANFLGGMIKEKRVLVILDDVFEDISLHTLGLLCSPTCKVLLTSRDKMDLFSEMPIKRTFPLGLLSEDETWSLFERMAGDAIKDDDIKKVATKVAKKCGGLPVLIVAVGSALRGRTLVEWKDALRHLKRFDGEGPTEKAFAALDWSYNHLKSQELKSLFLLCGTLAQGQSTFFLSDLLKYTMGLGLVRDVDTVEEVRTALLSLVKILKDSCLLLDGYNDATLGMHDLVRDVAVQIAYRDEHVLSRAYEELEEWPNKDIFTECSRISFRECTIPKLPESPWECPKLKLFYFGSCDNSSEIPNNFFEEMKELEVLDLTSFHLPSLPSSLLFLTNLQTLCLDQCVLGDIALVGELTQLRILSLLHSKVKELPKEIRKLTRLRLLDLTDCSELVQISPNVISSLTKLEDLRIGTNSFRQWEGEESIDERSNASVSELKHLSQLTALEIHIPDASVLPANLFSDKLERYAIIVGDCWRYFNVYGTFSSILKLKLAARNQFDQGIKFLLKRCEDLSVDGIEAVNIISHLLESDGVTKMKHLQIQNNDEITQVINSTSWSQFHNAFSNLESLSLYNLVSLQAVSHGQLGAQPFQKLGSLTLRNLPKFIGFTSKGSTSAGTAEEITLENEIGGTTNHFMDGEVLLPNLTSLVVDGCDSLACLFSSSMARRSLGNLKHLEIERCQIMEEIVANNDYSEASTDNMFCKLKRLKLNHLPSLAKFCSGSHIEFPSLEMLHIEDCPLLGPFVVDAKSESTTISNEDEDKDLKEILFDEKVTFPCLEILVLVGLPKLMTIWPNQLAPNSLCKLRIVGVVSCQSLINIFSPIMMRRLNALETLKIKKCQALQIIFEIGETSTGDQYFEFPCLEIVVIFECESLKNLFPSAVAKGLQRLRNLWVFRCGTLENIVANEGGSETTPTFVFPKVTQLSFRELPQLKHFYRGLHVARWPSLNGLHFFHCANVEIFSSQLTRFQEKHASGICSTIKQPFVLIDEGSFPNLEYLDLPMQTEIWYEPYGLLPPEFFSKLKTLHVGNLHPKSIEFLRRLDNLEKLYVVRAPWKEIFVYQGNSSAEETNVVGAFPRLKLLKLLNMDELVHLGDDPIFSKLEILKVYDCGRLEKGLISSPISFGNLTTLDVRGCGRLKYLTTIAVAKCLPQLKNLEVEDCESMTEIIARDKDDDSENEIVFSQLQHLKLSGLPLLRGFCIENCTVRALCLDSLDVSGCRIMLEVSPDGVLLSTVTVSFHPTMQRQNIDMLNTIMTK